MGAEQAQKGSRLRRPEIKVTTVATVRSPGSRNLGTAGMQQAGADRNAKMCHVPRMISSAERTEHKALYCVYTHKTDYSESHSCPGGHGAR